MLVATNTSNWRCPGLTCRLNQAALQLGVVGHPPVGTQARACCAADLPVAPLFRQQALPPGAHAAHALHTREWFKGGLIVQHSPVKLCPHRPPSAAAGAAAAAAAAAASVAEGPLPGRRCCSNSLCDARNILCQILDWIWHAGAHRRQQEHRGASRGGGAQHNHCAGPASSRCSSAACSGAVGGHRAVNFSLKEQAPSREVSRRTLRARGEPRGRHRCTATLAGPLACPSNS